MSVDFVSRAIAAAKPILDRWFADVSLVQTITIRRRGPIAWSAEHGRNVTTETDTTVSAIPQRHTQKSVRDSASALVQVGDLSFLVKQSDFSSNPTTADVLIWDSKSYDIKAIDKIVSLAYSITVQGA